MPAEEAVTTTDVEAPLPGVAQVETGEMAKETPSTEVVETVVVADKEETVAAKMHVEVSIVEVTDGVATVVVQVGFVRDNLAAIPADLKDLYSKSSEKVEEPAKEHEGVMKVPSPPPSIASHVR